MKLYKTFQLNPDRLEMVAIPGGSFMMGTEEEEIERLCKKYDSDRFRRESPQHRVTIQPFYLGNVSSMEDK